MLSPDEPWVLSTYDLARQTEGTVIVEAGVLLRRGLRAFWRDSGRSCRARPASPHDLMTCFEYDARATSPRRASTGETASRSGPGSVCGSSLPAPESGLVHEYAYGARTKTTHLGTSVHALDVDIDWRTGLVERSRDVSGLGTILGVRRARTGERPRPGPGRHSCACSTCPRSGDASLGLTPARIDVAYRNATGSTTLAAETIRVRRGRAAVVREPPPSRQHVEHEKHTEYTKAGHTERVSEWTGEGGLARVDGRSPTTTRSAGARRGHDARRHASTDFTFTGGPLGHPDGVHRDRAGPADR